MRTSLIALVCSITNPSRREKRSSGCTSRPAERSAVAEPDLVEARSADAGDMTAGAIAALFDHAWPTTTRHLQVLESAGLLRHERRGRQRVYSIDRARLELARDWLAWFSKPRG